MTRLKLGGVHLQLTVEWAAADMGEKRMAIIEIKTS